MHNQQMFTIGYIIDLPGKGRISHKVTSLQVSTDLKFMENFGESLTNRKLTILFGTGFLETLLEHYQSVISNTRSLILEHLVLAQTKEVPRSR